VRLRVAKTAVVQISLGWHSFVSGNRLKEGDSLIFLLKEDARSEFEVHVFRGPEGSPHFPDKGEDSPIDEEDEGMYVSASKEETISPSPGHHEVELNKAFINNLKCGKAAPFSHTKHLEKHRIYPGFRKRLTASNIQRSNGDSNGGHFVSFLTRTLKLNNIMRLPIGSDAFKSFNCNYVFAFLFAVKTVFPLPIQVFSILI